MAWLTHLGRPLWGFMSTYGIFSVDNLWCEPGGDKECAALEPQHLIEDGEENGQ